MILDVDGVAFFVQIAIGRRCDSMLQLRASLILSFIFVIVLLMNNKNEILFYVWRMIASISDQQSFLKQMRIRKSEIIMFEFRFYWSFDSTVSLNCPSG